MMKKQLLMFMFALLPLMASADAVEIDGIYYNLVQKAKQAEVTYNPNNVKYTGSVVIPEQVSYEGYDYSVTSIGNDAFYYSSGLTSVTIPNSVTSIGNSTFYACSGLTSVIIPNSVTSIDYQAFYGCSGLTSVTIPNSVTSIGEYAFRDCSSMISVSVGNSVTSIGNDAFFGCSALTSVHISDIAAWCRITFYSPNSNPLHYGHNLYLGEQEIKNLVIPNSITSIGGCAFCGCSGLTSVTIPNSVTSIGDLAFAGCSGLTSVTIPNSVTSIGGSAFSDCSGLTSVTIPNSVTSIGEGTFGNCSGLTSITIPNSVTSIGWHAFSDCSGLTSVTIGNGLTSISNWTFIGCSGLTSVIIPNSVTSIDYQAFYGCSGLTSVTIGSGVTNIFPQAFASCPELTDVYCYAEKVPSTETNAFEGSYIEYATLHVPDASLDSYSSIAPWSSFGKKVGLSGSGPVIPEAQKCATPTISYQNGKLIFSCETEGATCLSTITDTDIASYSDNEVQLSVTYHVSVYATKGGYENSDVATATLCWIDKEPTIENTENGVAQVSAQAVLIQSEGGIITIQGVDDGTPVSVYAVSGMKAGTAISRNGAALINTNLQTGSVAIVRVGNKSVRIVVK